MAVLAIDLTWPDASTVEGLPYEPWTVALRWEQMMVEKVEGLGGVLLPHAPSLLLFAFGIPQTLEQSPQRAVHTALMLRQLVGDESPLACEGPRPAVRLGLHWGPVLVTAPAHETPLQVLAVGETLAIPVRLQGQATPGEVLASAAMGRLVTGWCALEPRAGIYVIGRASSGLVQLVAPAPRQCRRFVGRTRAIMVLTTC